MLPWQQHREAPESYALSEEMQVLCQAALEMILYQDCPLRAVHGFIGVHGMS